MAIVRGGRAAEVIRPDCSLASGLVMMLLRLDSRVDHGSMSRLVVTARLTYLGFDSGGVAQRYYSMEADLM